MLLWVRIKSPTHVFICMCHMYVCVLWKGSYNDTNHQSRSRGSCFEQNSKPIKKIHIESTCVFERVYMHIRIVHAYVSRSMHRPQLACVCVCGEVRLSPLIFIHFCPQRSQETQTPTCSTLQIQLYQ